MCNFRRFKSWTFIPNKIFNLVDNEKNYKCYFDFLHKIFLIFNVDALLYSNTRSIFYVLLPSQITTHTMTIEAVGDVYLGNTRLRPLFVDDLEKCTICILHCEFNDYIYFALVSWTFLSRGRIIKPTGIPASYKNTLFLLVCLKTVSKL